MGSLTACLLEAFPYAGRPVPAAMEDMTDTGPMLRVVREGEAGGAA